MENYNTMGRNFLNYSCGCTNSMYPYQMYGNPVPDMYMRQASQPSVCPYMRPVQTLNSPYGWSNCPYMQQNTIPQQYYQGMVPVYQDVMRPAYTDMRTPYNSGSYYTMGPESGFGSVNGMMMPMRTVSLEDIVD